MLSFHKIAKVHKRQLSKLVFNDRSSKGIRKKFLDYFTHTNHHNFVKSSPVVPFCDPTLAFVNAGMNQFKNIFLGVQEAAYKRVANSQKCIRVGGKHNDLNVIGTDGYHHTFFEMLGNWSFGDYFKKEACELAWNLLTKEYKINPARLYVTYFKGDPSLGLKEDLETKEIWRSIGVPDCRILPFDSKDNFWEMGLTGPCGPCTEIHIDHITSVNRSKLVNKGLHDLTELWNIVFIEYNRNEDGTVSALPEKHVDTGMGFERLTAVLQKKISNYDTDNFSYLLQAIHKNCSGIPRYHGRFGENDWDSLDAAYRTLADHTRMVTVCLADGIIPESNQKLRRIMRRAFLLSESVFKRDAGLLKELSNYVIEHLGSVYNEIEHNAQQIHQIIDYEEEVYKTIRKTAAEGWNKLVKINPKLETLDVIETPSIVAACKEIIAVNPQSIDDQFGFKLYDTFGLDFDAIDKLGVIFNLNFDKNGLKRLLAEAKLKSKQVASVDNKICEKLTDLQVKKTQTLMYDYEKINKKYSFPRVEVKILRILKNAEYVSEIGANVNCFLLLDKTNFYSEAGGQIGDIGEVLLKNAVFKITNTVHFNGYILHEGFLSNGKLKLGDNATLCLNSEFRLNNMRNHTAVHLLNAVVKEIKGATCQKSSKVTDQYLKLDLGIFGEKISITDVAKIEQKIRNIIEKNLDVKCRSVDLTSLDYVTMIPGEIYDTPARLIEIVGPDGFISREPCCGTHVFSTSDLEDFSIINVKSLGRSTVSIYAVTGDRAKLAKSNAAAFAAEIANNKNLQMLKERLHFNVHDSTIIPYVDKINHRSKLGELFKANKETIKHNLKEFIEDEMDKALKAGVSKTNNNQQYIIHTIKSVGDSENISLQNATKLCPNIPVLVVLRCDDIIKARCCVPKNLQNHSFNAEMWLKQTLAATLGGKVIIAKGQDGGLVCNMKAKKIREEDLNSLLEKGLRDAKNYIEEKL